MNPTDQGDAVQCEIRIAARPETIFPFFTDPDKLVRWKGVEANLDPASGGVYWVNVTGHESVRGRYLEVEPYRRVVFTWGWEGDGSPVPPGSSTVEITLIPDGDGTIVRLRHYGLPEDQKPQHAMGWEHYLGRLAVAGAGGDPGPDPWAHGQQMGT